MDDAGAGVRRGSRMLWCLLPDSELGRARRSAARSAGRTTTRGRRQSARRAAGCRAPPAGRSRPSSAAANDGWSTQASPDPAARRAQFDRHQLVTESHPDEKRDVRREEVRPDGARRRDCQTEEVGGDSTSQPTPARANASANEPVHAGDSVRCDAGRRRPLHAVAAAEAEHVPDPAGLLVHERMEVHDRRATPAPVGRTCW